MGQIMLWTAAAIVVGAVVIGGAFLLTQKPGSGSVPSPITPGVLTPADIPQNGTTLGLSDAKVTIDLWSDFRCTACFAFTVGSDTETKLLNNYVRTGKAKLVYHDLIVVDLIQGHEGETESRDAANAAICAADQGKFWLFHDWLFANQSAGENPGYFTIDRLVQIGQLSGMDMSKFKPCVEQGSHLDQVKAELDQFHAVAPNAKLATPTVLVGGAVVSDPSYQNIAAAIDAALTGASPSPSASASASPSASVAASASASPSASASATASVSASASATPTAKPS
jgi:protein-disulfide isomerase